MRIELMRELFGNVFVDGVGWAKAVGRTMLRHGELINDGDADNRPLIRWRYFQLFTASVGCGSPRRPLECRGLREVPAGVLIMQCSETVTAVETAVA